jgi:PAS domain S-box-containing protein
MKAIQLERIIRAFPENIYWKDINSVYIGCSDVLAQWAGYGSAKDIIGKTDHDLIWKRQANTFIEHDRKVMALNKPDIIEEPQMLASGDWILVRTIKAPFHDEQGQVAGVTGLSIDISAFGDIKTRMVNRMAIDNAIRKAESDFLNSWYQEVTGKKLDKTLSPEAVGNKLKFFVENIIDKLPANIFWMDTTGKVLGCNRSEANIFGFKETSELIGKAVHDLVAFENAESIIKNNEKVFASDRTCVIEEQLFDGNGQALGIFLSYKAPLFDDEGKTIGLMGVSFDITERKEMERDLILTKEKSEAANLAKTAFLNNMRHDLRTPVSCTLGAARILRQMEKSPEKLEFIDGIISQNESLLQMLTNMLEFDAVQSRERPVQLDEVDIVKLTHDVIQMLSLAAKKKGLDLYLKISPMLPRLLVTDGYRLQRILLNIINNAIKFTDNGYVSVTVALSNVECLLIEVQDTGVGIAPDMHQTIFERFVRVVDANKGLYDGEGLGLSIVKQFADDLKAAIDLKSALGDGTLFRLVVPVVFIKETLDESVVG